jgi:hypothetical protein
MRYNTKIEVFPSNIIANLFGLGEGEFFELEEGSPEREAPEVSFN